MQGDVLAELIDGHGLRAIDIARVTGRRPNDLSQLYNTAKMFPPAMREPDVPFNSYLLAMRMSRSKPCFITSPPQRRRAGRPVPGPLRGRRAENGAA